MSVTLVETQRSRQFTSSESPSARREYTAIGAEQNPEIVELWVLAQVPVIIDGLVRKSITLTPRDNDATTFDVVVDYGKAKTREQPQINQEEISFEISPQTVRLTQSKETKQSVPLHAPNFGGGVGFADNGFEGADVFVEAFTFSITKYVPATLVTNAYIKQLRDASFHVNDAAWRGFNAGECLFMGASGARRSEDDYAMTFRFSASSNVTGYSIDANITGINKGGWEYLWVLYDQRTHAGSGRVIKKPVAAYVERFYDSANFPSLLGLEA